MTHPIAMMKICTAALLFVAALLLAQVEPASAAPYNGDIGETRFTSVDRWDNQSTNRAPMKSSTRRRRQADGTDRLTTIRNQACSLSTTMGGLPSGGQFYHGRGGGSRAMCRWSISSLEAAPMTRSMSCRKTAAPMLPISRVSGKEPCLSIS